MSPDVLLDRVRVSIVSWASMASCSSNPRHGGPGPTQVAVTKAQQHGGRGVNSRSAAPRPGTGRDVGRAQQIGPVVPSPFELGHLGRQLTVDGASSRSATAASRARSPGLVRGLEFLFRGNGTGAAARHPVGHENDSCTLCAASTESASTFRGWAGAPHRGAGRYSPPRPQAETVNRGSECLGGSQ